MWHSLHTPMLWFLSSYSCKDKAMKTWVWSIYAPVLLLLVLHKFGEQDSQIWMPDIWCFLGFSDFSLWSPHETMKIKVAKMTSNFERFQEILKQARRFWKLQLSMSVIWNQKVSNVRHPYLRILSPFVKRLIFQNRNENIARISSPVYKNVFGLQKWGKKYTKRVW